jgi:putative ABC transport system permease protein
MRLLRMFRYRLRSLLRRRSVDDETERELSLHFEQLVREHLRNGASEADARRAARREFGSPDLAREQCRDARRVGLIDDLTGDVAYGARMLTRTPAFTATAVLSIALGIGANTAIFSVVDAVVLRSLPVHRPQDLVFVHVAGSRGLGGAPPYPCIQRFQTASSAFTGMAAYATDELRIDVDGTAEQVFGQVASGSYFDVLGLVPAAGRLLRPADTALDPPVAVLGYAYAERRFGGAASAVGRSLRNGARTYTIVGVTPPSFWGLEPGRRIELTLPITAAGGRANDPGAFWLDLVARLDDRSTVPQATAQLDAIFQGFMNERDRRPDVRRQSFDHIELRSAARGEDRLRARFTTPLLALMFAAGGALLMACANLGGLLLVRGAARGREIALRFALGASAGRIVRQLLTETQMLFAVGAGVGVAIAPLAVSAMTGFFASGRNPIVIDVRYDWRLAAFAAAVTLVAGVVTGLWPALRARRSNPRAAIASGVRTTGSRESRAGGRAAVIVQVAVTVVLLAAAVMFAATMRNLRDVNLGFTPARVLTMSLDPFVANGADAADVRERFWSGVLERVRRLPGVRAASLSVLTPLSGRSTGRQVTVPGFQASTEAEREILVNHVSDDFFRTQGILLAAGRVFTAADNRGAAKVMVVNETAARVYFAGRNPLGEFIGVDGAGSFQIVGIVGDHKHRSVREPPQRFAYIPLPQAIDPIGRITLSVASDQPQAALARMVGDEVRAVRRNALVSDVIGVEEQIDATLMSERLLAALAGSFAAVALALAAIGLYGVISYTVARRRAEIGIRLALGARRANIAASVCREVLLQVGAGLVIGLPLAIAAGRAARTMLFGVTPNDTAPYAAAAIVVALVASAAAWIPIRRAVSIDPLTTLRAEH